MPDTRLWLGGYCKHTWQRIAGRLRRHNLNVCILAFEKERIRKALTEALIIKNSSTQLEYRQKEKIRARIEGFYPFILALFCLYTRRLGLCEAFRWISL